MDIDAVKNAYKRMTVDELSTIDKATLTNEAKKVLEQELKLRKVSLNTAVGTPQKKLEPTGYITQSLLKGEEIICWAKLHIILVVMSVILALLAIFAGGIASVVVGNLVPLYISLGIGLLVVAETVIKRETTQFALTNIRLIGKKGIISRHTIELLLKKVESINVKQSILGRFLNFGTLIVTGTGGVHEIFETIYNPIQFKLEIQEAIEKLT